jgi:hypothetical protein
MIKEITATIIVWALWLIMFHYWLDICTWLMNDGRRVTWNEMTMLFIILSGVIPYGITFYIFIFKPFSKKQ